MSFPSYVELGKAARELFTKGYNHGFIRVDTFSKSGDQREVEFATSAVHNIDNGRLSGNFSVKYRIPSCGVILTEKWNTDNLLGTVVEIQDQFMRGLKVTLDSWYALQTGKRSGRVKADWITKNAATEMDVVLDPGPLVNFSVVSGTRGFLTGIQAAFDVSSSQFKGTSFAFGKVGLDYALHTFVNNGREFGASYVHRVSPNVDIGAHLGWIKGENGARFGIGAKYCPTHDLELKGKIESDSKIALSLVHHLSKQLLVTFSSQCELGNLNAGGHSLGFGLQYNSCS